MSGGGSIPDGNGGKKPVDFEINLIPCIDLFSVLIAFLLMTAVWTEIAKIDVKQKPNQQGEDQPEPKEDEALRLSIFVKVNGYTVTMKGAAPRDIQKKGDQWDAQGLSEVLKAVVAQYPGNNDVTVRSEDSVPYQQLISVMDACLTHSLQGITVSGIEG